MLEVLIAMARCPIEHVVDPQLVRSSDVTLQIPDSSKFRAATGWQPRIPLETTLRDLLEHHRARLGTRQASFAPGVAA
jgi:GDPmannose 4,6-dehydratase/GDP-4-dehydro-6-deoxy-D-mannose reductase